MASRCFCPPETLLPPCAIALSYPSCLLSINSVACAISAASRICSSDASSAPKRRLLAIVPEKRNYGYGSRGLEALLKKFKNHKYIFEIETQDEKAENAEERKKRKAFYLRNGLQETGLFVNVYETDFEILTPDGELTFWEYVDFLREVMYEEYVQILRPTLIAMKK